MLIDPNKLILPPTVPVHSPAQGQTANSARVMPAMAQPMDQPKQAIPAAEGLRQGPGKKDAALDLSQQSSKPEDLQKAVNEVKQYIQSYRRDLSLDYDDESGRLVIKIIDRDTDEVVRQIPPEEILAFIHNMLRLEEGREGVLLREKA